MCPIPKVVSTKVHIFTSHLIITYKTLPYVFSPRRPDTPRILFLKFLRGKNVVYEYNVHIYISHFFFIRDKVECHYTLLSHFYVVLVCRRAEWHFTVQIMVWSHCKNKTTVGNPGTIGLSLINNWSVGLIKGICNMCVLRCSGYLFEGC